MVAVVFVSVEGVGKDLFFEWFGNNILGIDHYFNKYIIQQLKFRVYHAIQPLFYERSKIVYRIPHCHDKTTTIMKGSHYHTPP